MKHLVPHAIILAGLFGLMHGYPETACLIAMAAGHVLVPVRAALHADKTRTTRALMRGPMVVIGAHVAMLIIAALGLICSHPEDSWIAAMGLIIWAAGLVIYAVYCLLAFELIVRLRR